MSRNKKMVERTIHGTITKWSKPITGFKKDGKTPYAASSCQIKDEWHRFFAENLEKIKQLQEEAPIGSTVEFTQYQTEGSEYWNFKEATLKILEKAQEETNNNKPIAEKKDWSEVKDLRIIRMNALNRATDIQIARGEELVIEEIILLAEQLTAWIKDGTKKETQETIIPEEEVLKDGS